MAFADPRVAPARKKLETLMVALYRAQEAASKAIGTAPATDKIATEVLVALEGFRRRINKMNERAERSGGVL